MIVGPLFPNKVNNKCPAIMFAVNRTANVPGRIKFLIVSIHTMNGIKIDGVPWGTKCSNIWFMLLIHPNSMNLTHKGSANVSVIARCLVLVKMYGNSPRKLLNKINENRDTNRNVPPFLFLLLPNSVLNSLWSFVVNKFHVIKCRDGISHILIGININPMNVLAQLSGIFIVLVGSNTENRFLIIFS